MRRLATFVAVAFIALFASAQEKMKITLTDGSTVEYNVEEVVKVYFEAPQLFQEPVDLGLSVMWASWNVGAMAPEEVGNYYAWGETTTKESYYNTDYNYAKQIPDDISSTEFDAAYVTWGENWRMPTSGEAQELAYYCDWSRAVVNGMQCYKVTGPNGNSIILPCSGFKIEGTIEYPNTCQYYTSNMCSWSSYVAKSLGTNDNYLPELFDWNLNSNNQGRFFGMPIRPVCNKTSVTYSGSGASAFKPKDLTEAIKCASYTENMYYGWFGSAPTNVTFGCFEHWNRNFDNYQKIEGLPEGYYEISVNGFYRRGGAADDYRYFTGSNSSAYNHSVVFAESTVDKSETPLPYASSCAQPTTIGSGRCVTVGNGQYIPNDMQSANDWFMNGYYKNTIRVKVGKDGLLKIGLRKSTLISNDWTIIGNWKLIYYGTKGYTDKEPEVKTGDATDITTNSAVLHGSLANVETEVPAGIIVSTSSNLTYENREKTGKSELGNGEYYYQAKNLSSSTKYYYRAFAYYNDKYYYGDVKSFVTKAPEYTLSVSPTSMSFDHSSASKSISITSNTDWTVKSSASWLTVSKTSGTGNASVNLSASANTNTSSRSATVTITGGGKTVTCSVTQAAAPAPEPSIVMLVGAYQVSADAKTVNVYVSSNTSWTVSSNQTWAKPTQTSGSGDMTLPVSVSANPNSTSRTATLTFTAGTKTAKCQIVQDGKKATILFEEPFITWGTQRTNVMSTMKTKGYTLYSNDATADSAPLTYDGKYEEVMSIYRFNSSLRLNTIQFYFDAAKVSVSQMETYLQNNMSYEYMGQSNGITLYASESTKSVVAVAKREVNSEISVVIVEYIDPSTLQSAKNRNATSRDIDTSAFNINSIDEKLIWDLLAKKQQDNK